MVTYDISQTLFNETTYVPTLRQNLSQVAFFNANQVKYLEYLAYGSMPLDEQAIQGIANVFFYPLDLINFVTTNSVYVPGHNETTGTHDGDGLVINDVNTLINGYLVSGETKMYKYISIAFNTLVPSKYNNFLDYAPYTKIYLYLPLTEPFELDYLTFKGQTFEVQLSIDFQTAVLTWYIGISLNGMFKCIFKRQTEVGIEIPIAKTNTAEIGQARNNILISALGNSVKGLGLAGAGALMSEPSMMNQALGTQMKTLDYGLAYAKTFFEPIKVNADSIKNISMIHTYETPMIVIDRPICRILDNSSDKLKYYYDNGYPIAKVFNGYDLLDRSSSLGSFIKYWISDINLGVMANRNGTPSDMQFTQAELDEFKRLITSSDGVFI